MLWLVLVYVCGRSLTSKEEEHAEHGAGGGAVIVGDAYGVPHELECEVANGAQYLYAVFGWHVERRSAGEDAGGDGQVFGREQLGGDVPHDAAGEQREEEREVLNFGA